MSGAAPRRGGRVDPVGVMLLVTNTTGWGLNWPAMKVLLGFMPPLSVRGIAGIIGLSSLLLIALIRREPLGVPRSLWGRLTLISLLNITGWMGLSSFSLLWLSAGEATIVCYTVAVWASLFAWPILGERFGARRVAALALALAGIALLVLGRGLDIGLDKLPGVGFGLGAAILFALGTVLTKRWPLGLPPVTMVVWQVAIGCAPLGVAGLLLEEAHPGRLGTSEWLLMFYCGFVGLGVAYLPWFAALRRLPASVAALGTLITPVVGVLGAAAFLGEPLGVREMLALSMTIAGVALAVRG